MLGNVEGYLQNKVMGYLIGLFLRLVDGYTVRERIGEVENRCARTMVPLGPRH